MLYVDDQLPLDFLSAYDEVRPFHGRTLHRDVLLRDHVDALIVRSTTRVEKELLHDTSVRFVATATSGVDHLDERYLQWHGIDYAHAAGSNANAVAEYCMASMQSILPSLHGKTIAIIGYGHVGSCLAHHARAAGMHVLVNDPPKDVDGGLDLATCLTSADVVSLHVPLTHTGHHRTYHLLNAENLASIPPSTLLINASRGDVICQQALAQRVHAQTLNVVLDVWHNEPHVDAELALKALVATPHIAGHSAHAWQQGALMAARAWLRWRGVEALAIDDLFQRHASSIPRADTIRPVLEESKAFQEAIMHGNVADAFDRMRRQYQRRPEFLPSPW